MGGRGRRGRERERKGKRSGEQEEEGWGAQEQLSLLLGKEKERVASLVDAGEGGQLAGRVRVTPLQRFSELLLWTISGQRVVNVRPSSDVRLTQWCQVL